MYCPDLQCSVVSLLYDFPLRRGTLHMAPDNCCDMRACVALFERIDAEVHEILTFAGGDADTGYFKRGGGVWISGTFSTADQP